MLNNKIPSKDFSKKAFDSNKKKIYSQIYAYELLMRGNNKSAEKVLKNGLENDKKNAKIEGKQSVLEKIAAHDPRNAKATLDLMKYCIKRKETEKAIQAADRHIEFRGRSLEVRELLQSLKG